MNRIRLRPTPLSLAALLVLTACASHQTASGPDAGSADARTSASQSARPGGQAGSAANDLGAPFATRHARFTPVAFADLPGWNDAAVGASLSALRQSCAALGKRPAWQTVCAQAARQSPNNAAALRRFFEDGFYAYAVQDVASRSDEGIITGYYEPVLNGSRQRSERYPHPVHGVPADLLFLDSRAVQDGQQVWLTLDKRQLAPAAAGAPGARRYLVQLDGLTPGIRDKRYRVRIQTAQNGQAVVRPYWSRQDIEQRRLDAQVLAWVDDPYALYAMQIQGSGRIRLDGGNEVLRVAYGEQNGHPFLPQISAAREGAMATAVTAVKTRGLSAGGGAAGPAGGAASSGNDDEVRRIVAALGGRPAPAQPARPAASASVSSSPNTSAARPAQPSAAASSSAGANADPSVAAIIAALKGPAPAQAARPAASPSGGSAPKPAPDPAVNGHLIPQEAPVQADPSRATGIPDPSYVFFRRIPDGASGPPGALGVPLTAGSSIAVDPRTTPLGSPVFLSTVHTGSDTPINRLVFAQDTGGAIRGSVRADLFWGTGSQAGRQAASMKAPGRMWLLLPRAQEISALTAVRTRSAAGPGAGPLPDCVIADEFLCAED